MRSFTARYFTWTKMSASTLTLRPVASPSTRTSATFLTPLPSVSTFKMCSSLPVQLAVLLTVKPQERTLILHAFALELVGDPSFHGKIIPMSFFDVEPALRHTYPPPNLAFFRWHYAQAVKTHVRGFAWGVRRDAIPALVARAAGPAPRQGGPRSRSMTEASR